ncbi:MAG TPA: YjbE family putative metal transport protein [Stellaceae bacterium]|nr:YjbE family putative metal transport protein [Stellaceae bacterium]
MNSLLDPGALAALGSVIVIDVALAGDNAIAVAMAASGLPPKLRRRAIIAGAMIATLLRIALATIATRLLAIVGLTLAGGVLLLYVAWKLALELRRPAGGSGASTASGQAKSFRTALLHILAADLSMSLDNVLAIAGAARDHVLVLVLGLALSVALMAVASGVLARLMERWRWIGWIGLAMVTFVALRLIHDGSAEVIDRVLHL